MNTHQEHGLSGQKSVTRKKMRRSKRGKSEDQFQGSKKPANHTCLEFWLIANMTANQLVNAREDLSVPEDFMTGAEAIAVFDRFYDEVRNSYYDLRAEQDFIQWEDESFAEFADRALRYAFHTIFAMLTNDEGAPDAAEFLAQYQQMPGNEPEITECLPGSLNIERGQV